MWICDIFAARLGMVVVACLGLMSCYKPPVFLALYNNTSESVQVYVDEAGYEVKSNAELTVQLERPLPKMFHVCMGDTKLGYPIEVAPGYGEDNRAQLQIDEDGRVRILKVGAPFPLPLDALQPRKFPLIPKVEGNC